MRFLNAATCTAILFAVCSCKTGAVRGDVPARIVDPTPESRAEVLRVVSDALQGRAVRLTDDALSNSSLLIIEPSHLTGRDLRKPEHFQLVLSGSNCVLLHLGTGSRFELTDTNCNAE